MGHDMKIITVLGSTGSIGISSLNVISALGKDYKIFGISCNTNISLLYEQVKKFNPNYDWLASVTSRLGNTGKFKRIIALGLGRWKCKWVTDLDAVSKHRYRLYLHMHSNWTLG